MICTYYSICIANTCELSKQAFASCYDRNAFHHRTLEAQFSLSTAIVI